MQKLIFAFSTFRSVFSNANKIADLLPNVQSIKVWSLEELISSSSSNQKVGNSEKNLEVTSNEIENLLTKISRDSSNSLNVVINKNFSSLQEISRA